MTTTAIQHNVTGAAAPDGGRTRWLGSPQAASRIAILNGHAETWQARSVGAAFSVKWAPKGRVVYRSEGATHVLRPGSLMLLNSGQPYDMRFEGPSETFCIFFPDSLVRQASGGDPLAEFPNVVFRPGFATEQAALRDELADSSAWPFDLEARLLLVLDAAVASARRHRGDARRTGAVKATTARHRLARLEVARAIIADGGAENLEQVARAAGLSKFHLLRLFRAVFGVTPMKYAEGLRLDRAAHLLRGPAGLIEEISFGAGYETASAFGRAFRRRYGMSPTAYRRAARN
ncbi:AraC family transcriptional regulator [uncultured Phenylobacterium sp.]|uniref:AraC family transcriptional regulator n=1 Tax=uncultured Phenylobacterium sp. TaxID=349273 RepID=UPI0025E0C51B|nr:AraC family transcriptional regulator [uncultured Phenylobacterium sp.]